MAMAQTKFDQLNKFTAANWAAQVRNYAQLPSPSVFISDESTKILSRAQQQSVAAMRHALKATNSKYLADFNQMSVARKESFIKRVERHGKKQYPNQQHMRDIYAEYVVVRVSQELGV